MMFRAITPGAVFFGLIISSPALHSALTDPQASVDTALLRFLIGVAAAAVGLALLRTLIAGYARSALPQRRSSDAGRSGDQRHDR